MSTNNFPFSEYRPNCLLRTGENYATRHRLLQRRSRHSFPLIADRWWYCDRINTTIGRIENTCNERQTGRIQKFVGNCCAHGQIGTGWFLQRFRASLCALRTTHCDHIDVVGTIASQFWILPGHSARSNIGITQNSKEFKRKVEKMLRQRCGGAKYCSLQTEYLHININIFCTFTCLLN